MRMSSPAPPPPPRPLARPRWRPACDLADERARRVRARGARTAMSVSDRLRALDRRQQQSRRIGFVAAVIKKFGDDQAGQLAALISYYAFVSLFPLLLVFVTILGFVLQGDPDEQHRRSSTARSGSSRSSATSSNCTRSPAAPPRS